MRPAKSNPALNNTSNGISSSNNNNNNNFIRSKQQQIMQSPNSSMNNNWATTNGSKMSGAAAMPTASNGTAGGPTSPICRCRVMYLGSSVPLITKDGLQGIQEPLRKLYPMDKVSLESGTSVGIDSWLSVWSNGILIENVDDNGREVKRFFKIGALHYCAAVKYIPISAAMSQAAAMYSCSTLPNNPSAIMQQQQNLPRFLPLDSPYARQTDSSPPIFASILRRTTGIKVLECHAFICKREAAANALVRCCFHAYADTMYAKQIGADVNSIANETNDNSGTSFQETEHDFGAPQDQHDNDQHSSSGHFNEPGGRPTVRSRSKSIAALNDTNQDYRKNGDNYGGSGADDPEYCSLADNQHTSDNYSMNGRKNSIDREQYQVRDNLDWNGNSSNLKKQQKFSKSMHLLSYQNGNIASNQMVNANGGIANYTSPILINDAYPMMINPSTSVNYYQNSTPRMDAGFWPTPNKQSTSNQQPPFFNNPYAGRVPSYPPQEQVDSANGGGTLKSIRSMAANSIASTLLRSKRHAKSMAQLNKDKIISFHQPQAHHISSAHTMIGPGMMLPPVPPMFLPPSLAGGANIINGSQTMKLPSRSMVPMMMSQPMNFDTMTSKEMKKLLKKSAKYGIPPPNLNHLPPMDVANGLPAILPPMPNRNAASSMIGSHLIQNNGDGTLPLRTPSIYSDMFNNSGAGAYADMTPDMLLPMNGLPPPTIDQQQQPLTPILVKPNQEFLKSKAGKKWLKQQKEFKKLLPPHLDGLPIIFGPPPPEALEPHTGSLPPGRNIIPGCDNSIDSNRQRIYY